jgi:hypothetical protein
MFEDGIFEEDESGSAVMFPSYDTTGRDVVFRESDCIP